MNEKEGFLERIERDPLLIHLESYLEKLSQLVACLALILGVLPLKWCVLTIFFLSIHLCF